ncbi:MAG: 50S ribosomal protein L29 [Candidatus Marinimicrobia bacterium]|nr:50S ribosomal protein L29 [Candidatus Neomarinimicrobiota bacterium]MCF7851498.1 50S ribosomal protein L29 [Candidatus Neomarinimicrobiota bacterium]
MKTSELKDYSIEALQNKLTDNETEMANLRFQKALQQLEKPTRLRELRREIAQIKTVLRELELGLRKDKEQKA